MAEKSFNKLLFISTLTHFMMLATELIIIIIFDHHNETFKKKKKNLIDIETIFLNYFAQKSISNLLFISKS